MCLRVLSSSFKNLVIQLPPPTHTHYPCGAFQPLIEPHWKDNSFLCTGSQSSELTHQVSQKEPKESLVRLKISRWKLDSSWNGSYWLWWSMRGKTSSHKVTCLSKYLYSSFFQTVPSLRSVPGPVICTYYQSPSPPIWHQIGALCEDSMGIFPDEGFRNGVSKSQKNYCEKCILGLFAKITPFPIYLLRPWLPASIIPRESKSIMVSE